MRKVIVNEWMSLDGVAQAPGAPDEDTDGGFEHGRPLGFLDSRHRCETSSVASKAKLF